MITTNNGNEFKVGVINDGQYQGLAITLNGEIIARVEEDNQEKEINCYVYADMKDDDFTKKIKIEGGR